MTTAQRSRDHDVLERWVAEPAAFMREALAFEPYAKQVEMAEALRDHPRVCVVGCNGSGKDAAAARLLLWWLLTRSPSIAVVVGPTGRQVSDIFWGELMLAYQAARAQGVPLGGELQKDHLRFGPNHYALGFSTDKPWNLQGWHSPNLLLVITEAHGMDQAHIEALKRLQPKKLLMTGNPLTLDGEFYDAFHGKAELWNTVSIGAADTPNVQEGREVIPGLITQEWIDERRADWGEDSPLYVAAVLGRFPDNLDGGLVPLSAIVEAQQRTMEPTGPVVIACDVARSGRDKTVIVRRQGARARIVRKAHGWDLMRTVGELKVIWETERPSSLVVDVVGIGAGVVDRLRELDIPVVPFAGGERARAADRYANANAEAGWAMREWFVGGAADIEDDGELRGQLAGRKYTIQSDRRVMLQSKSELTKSPDLADALMMTFAVGGGAPNLRFLPLPGEGIDDLEPGWTQVG